MFHKTNIRNKLQHRGDFELLGMDRGAEATCKALFNPSPPGSAIKQRKKSSDEYKYFTL